jgi:twitching motility protein PilT
MLSINMLLAEAKGRDASDVHLKVNQKPFFRVHSALAEAEHPPLTAEDLHRVLAEILPSHLAASWAEQHEADFSHSVEGTGRFRVNAFLAQGVPAFAFRYVKTQVPSLAALHLPPSLGTVAQSPRGILIVSGATGSGKSTTLAALLDLMNETDRLHIITIEDPIEYMFTDKLSRISQREVGLDTLSFQQALRHVLRQDPDVIVIGEMRDRTGLSTALSAAETGHMVLTTLHSATASQAVHRMLEFFPSTDWEQTRMSLAANLHGVLCQRLVRATQGGVVPAVEILINTPTVRKLIETDRLEVLPAAIETGGEDGMQTFNQALYHLIKGGMITQDEGMQYATNPGALRMNLQGIFLDEARRILGA